MKTLSKNELMSSAIKNKLKQKSPNKILLKVLARDVSIDVRWNQSWKFQLQMDERLYWPMISEIKRSF